MLRTWSLVTALVSITLITAVAQVKIKKTPITHTSPASGKDMYVSYCGACHGVDGTGNGPAIAALKVPPTDLTKLAAHNKGQYPASKVSESIRSGVTPAHGSAEMPIWGPLFRDLCGSEPAPSTQVELRIHNLTEYIKSIQQKSRT
jgi:mono/diheme cytochrome c family protein